MGILNVVYDVVISDAGAITGGAALAGFLVWYAKRSVITHSVEHAQLKARQERAAAEHATVCARVSSLEATIPWIKDALIGLGGRVESLDESVRRLLQHVHDNNGVGKNGNDGGK